MIRVRQDKPLDYGYTPIAAMDENEDNTMMDFGVLRLRPDESYSDSSEFERMYLLVTGRAVFQWEGKSEVQERKSCFDEDAIVMHLPKNVEITITAESDTEICAVRTENERSFSPKLYKKEDCRSEHRGKGTMNETSTRIVRTVVDYSNGKHSNLVIGEVIDYPGKWSSYPPHYHPQPEIYYYKFCPENGYGFCELGEDVVKLRNNDTVKILNNVTHPQATAPGYAMYYLWVIRHIDENPYIEPTFVPEHLWVTKPDAKIWPER